MRTMLAHVADLEGGAVTELLLDRQVPLLRKCGLHLRIPHAEQRAGKRVRTRARRWDNALICRGRECAAMKLAKNLSRTEGRVDRESQVGSRPFHVARNRERSTNDGLFVECRRRPSKAYTRLEVLATVGSLIQAAIAVLAREWNAPQQGTI